MAQALQLLMDKEDIRSARVRFGHAVDKRDWAAMDAIFAEDVDVDLSQFGVPAARMKRGDLVTIYQHAFRHDAVRTQQNYSSFIIDVSGDRATCQSYLHGYHTGQGFEGGDVWELHAEYVDQLTRTEAGWRISAMTLNVLSIVGNMALVS